MDPSLYRGDHTMLYCLSQSCGVKARSPCLYYRGDHTVRYVRAGTVSEKFALYMLQKRPRTALPTSSGYE